MNAQSGVDIYSSTLSFTFPVDWVDGKHHAPAASPPEITPSTYCTVGWLILKTSVDGCGRSQSHQDSIPGMSTPSELLYRLLECVYLCVCVFVCVCV